MNRKRLVQYSLIVAAVAFGLLLGLDGIQAKFGVAQSLAIVALAISCGFVIVTVLRPLIFPTSKVSRPLSPWWVVPAVLVGQFAARSIPDSGFGAIFTAVLAGAFAGLAYWSPNLRGANKSNG